MLSRNVHKEGGYYLNKFSLEHSCDEEKVGGMLEHTFKVLIIGDSTVGKTSFVQRYVENTFRREYKGTVGVDFAIKILKWTEEDTVKLHLWDIAGQERYTWMTRVYYKGAQGAIIMFDLTNERSFLNTLKWKKEVDNKCTTSGGNPIPCVLLANKCDAPLHRRVTQQAIEHFQKKEGFVGWTEISVKEGLMINDAMSFLIDVMKRQTDLEGKKNEEEAIQLADVKVAKKRTCKCNTS